MKDCYIEKAQDHNGVNKYYIKSVSDYEKEMKQDDSQAWNYYCANREIDISDCTANNYINYLQSEVPREFTGKDSHIFSISNDVILKFDLNSDQNTLGELFHEMYHRQYEKYGMSSNPNKEELEFLLEYLDSNQQKEEQISKPKSLFLVNLEDIFKKQAVKYLAKVYSKKELSSENSETLKKVTSSKDFDKIADKAIKDSDILTNYQKQLKKAMDEHKIKPKSGLLGSILDRCINAPNHIRVKQLEIALKNQLIDKLHQNKSNICKQAIDSKSKLSKIIGR